MLKRIEDILFLLLFVTFLFLSILFSSVNENEINYDLQESSSKKFGEQFLWTKSPDKELANIDFNDFAIPSYDPSRVSIFGDAIQSLMDYYVKVYEPLQIKGASNNQPLSDISLAYVPGKPVPSRSGRYNSNGNGPAEEFFFASYDKYKKVYLPQQLVRNGHMAVKRQFVSLPRIVSEKDRSVKFSKTKVEPMFLAHYKNYFGFDFKANYGKSPSSLSAKKIRRKLENYWSDESRYRGKCFDKIKKDLLLNPSVVKLTGCRYSFEGERVIIYYNLKTDLFCVVGENTNSFITGGVASLCDYIDIYYFKWLYNNKAFNESQHYFDQESKKLFNSDLYKKEDRDYSINRDKGLGDNYDPTRWWGNKQEELVPQFLELIHQTPEWYENLKIGDTGKINDTSEMEAFTLLQFAAEKYVYGIYRPDKANDPRERRLDTDARFDDFNRDRIPDYINPTIIDVKVLIDPQALLSDKMRSLEQQINDTVNSVKFQQDRAKTEFNETVLHVINLFRIRPVDRPFVIASFKAKAIKKEIDLDCVIFLNTNDDSIY
jgi:hypothetical protein